MKEALLVITIGACGKAPLVPSVELHWAIATIASPMHSTVSHSPTANRLFGDAPPRYTTSNCRGQVPCVGEAIAAARLPDPLRAPPAAIETLHLDAIY
jgi:hypothetical protein